MKLPFPSLPPALSRAFTLIELLIVVAIISILAALLFPSVGKMLAKGKTTQSVSNLRQIHSAILGYASDNDGNYPYSYGNGALPPGGTDREFWYNAVKVRLYPHPTAANRSALDGANGWGTPNVSRTVLRSPNVEKAWPTSVISYGYNNRFAYSPTNSAKLALVYNSAKTVMLADNLGNTQFLTPEYGSSFGKLNARNGATRDNATNGVAIAVFIDGHTEMLSAAECARLNADRNMTNEFWGIRQN